jgi:6-phosphogluconolactonase (cycloisomerase 2 family)
MKRIAVVIALIAAVATALAGAQAAYTKNPKHPKRGHPGSGHHWKGHRSGRVVFVQTNELNGNRIAVYHRNAGGTLALAGTYATGGNGGIASPGNEPDRIASQGSLVYDAGHRLLFAVNAGSDTVSTFRVRGDRLKLKDIDASGGGFPASIAVHRNLVYVLNAGGTGIVQGFRIRGNHLRPIGGSARSLGLANSDPPNFLTSPGQVGFTPDGGKLIVTTKGSGSHIVVFSVGGDGRLSTTAVVNNSATPVPFAFTFTPTGRLASGEAGTSNLTTYLVNGNGTLADPKTLSDGQMALCWIVRVGPYYYVTNTMSSTVSGFTVATDGQPSLIDPDGVLANTGMGPIDMTVSGRYLYLQTGAAGTVEAYRINGDGTLTSIGSVPSVVGQEGIASN